MPDWIVGQPVLLADLNTIVPSGFDTAFDMDAAPSGWTRNVDAAENDRVIRLRAAPAGGGVDTWTLTGLSAPHTHSTQRRGVSVDESFNWTSSSDAQTSGASAGIVADGTWRPVTWGVIRASRTAADLTGNITSTWLNSLFPSGTRALFDSDVAPLGWSRVAPANDALARVVTGTRPGLAGSWTITGLSFSHSHTLNFNATVSNNISGPVLVIRTQPGASSPAVTSDGSWRPAYRDMIVAQRVEPNAPANAVVTARMLNTVAPAGTRTVVYNTTTPNGWSRDTSIDDRVVRLVSGTRTPSGGSWTVSGLAVASHGHAFTLRETDGNNAQVNAVYNISAAAPAGTSDGTWRPRCRDASICVRI
jgi:hypothetical protein